MKNAIFAFSVIASVVFVPAAQAEESGKFSLEAGVDYNSGKYGGSQSTDVLYVPVTAKYQSSLWSVKLTVPYLQITGPGNVINVLNGVTVTGAASTPVTRSGMGDVIAAATHNVYNSNSGFLINLTGKIKFGTASRSQGMGTGKNDYALQTDAYQVSGKFITFGTLGYRVYGSTAAYTLNNAYYGSLGVSYRFDQATNGGLMLDAGQKITATGASHKKAIVFINHKLDSSWKAQGYLLKGFTNSVPDWGGGASATYVF